MLNVVICDDDQAMLNQIACAVNDAIGWDNLSNIKVECLASNAKSVIELVEKGPKPRLFLLDIDLDNTVYDGLKLGEKIRESDVNSDIVYITSHSDKGMDTFKYRVAALAFIVKDPDELNAEVRKIIQYAHKRFKEGTKTGKKFKLHGTRVVVGDAAETEGNDEKSKYFIDLSQIVFFESDAERIGKNKVELHGLEEDYLFRGTLKEIEAFDDKLVRISGSKVINIDHVQGIYRDDYDAWQIKMVNGIEVEASAKGRLLVEALIHAKATRAAAI